MVDEKEKIIFVKESIFKTIIKKYIVGDLERMLKIDINTEGYGSCNFPIALYLFAVIEFLGYLFSENEIKSESGYTVKRINAYFDLFFNDEDKREISPHKEDFANIYRNGLVHTYFPNGMAIISRVEKKLLTRSPEGYMVLDANIFAEMFIRSINSIEGKLNDRDFCLRTYNRYEGYINKMRKMSNINVPSNYDNSVGGTGASHYYV